MHILFSCKIAIEIKQQKLQVTVLLLEGVVIFSNLCSNQTDPPQHETFNEGIAPISPFRINLFQSHTISVNAGAPALARWPTS